MVHDFTLVYALDSGMGSQEDVLRRLADSDCADATVGWGRPEHVGLAFSREASDHDAAVTLATAQISEIDARLRRLAALRAELQRMATSCEGGVVGDCRIIETLADFAHGHCADPIHRARG